MVVDELGEYLILKGYTEMDSTRFKRGNTIIYLGLHGGQDTFKITESGEETYRGSGIFDLSKKVK